MLQAAPATAAAAAAATTAGRTPLTTVGPAWATGSTDAGAVPSNKAQNIRVYLTGADPQEIAAYATAVSTPGTAEYRHYLTPQQYRARFGASAAQTSAIEAWLTAAGFRITSANWQYVDADGDGTAVRAAFGTTLSSYRTAAGVQQAPASAVTVPAALAPAVLTVSGLTTAATAEPAGDLEFGSRFVADPDGASGSAPINVGACSEYYGQKEATDLPPAYGSTLRWDLCGYEPAQLRSAYGVAGTGLTGRGVTIAVVDAGPAPTLEQDVDTYSRDNGLPTLRPGQFGQNVPSDIDTSCPAAPAYESTLDVEAAHVTAPGADLLYVGADCSSVTDDLDAELRIVDGHLADIVGDSWHFGIEQQLPPDLVTAFDRVMEQGAIEGIGFYFSSGDNGDWSEATADHTPAVQYPASDPWVTSVGGTSLAVDARNRYLFETGWGTMSASPTADGSAWAGLPGTFSGGAGGGRSALFGQPAYQRGTVPAALSTSGGSGTPMRVVPDIAADADPETGMLIGITLALAPGAAPVYAEGRVGGTSLSTPLVAGIQADAQQADGGIPLGFADPALYQRYRSPDYRDVVDDPLGPGVTLALADESISPTTGAAADTAVTLGRDQSLTATRGYDDVTGLGTPTARYLESYRGW
jgi:subtilase family serine protease